MEDKNKTMIETGAMTLVLLVQNYKSQMIALLLKNGVTVQRGASNQQIANIMANLLKISKSYAKDLQIFISNPKVIEVLSGGFNQNAQYFRASGFAGKNEGNAQYFRMTGFGEGLPKFDPNIFSTENTTTSTTTPAKKSFWSGLNFADLLNKGLETFGSIDKNKTDRAIANAQVQIGSNVGSGTKNTVETEEEENPNGKKTPDDEGISTTTIVVLSLVGVAIIGTIIYFVARPKK
jgi:hypothetical protein